MLNLFDAPSFGKEEEQNALGVGVTPFQSFKELL